MSRLLPGAGKKDTAGVRAVPYPSRGSGLAPIPGVGASSHPSDGAIVRSRQDLTKGSASLRTLAAPREGAAGYRLGGTQGVHDSVYAPTVYPYVWTWRHRTIGAPYTTAAVKVPWFPDGVDRVGQRCRVVCRGTMNTAWIEFENGHQTITSRGALRRITREVP